MAGLLEMALPVGFGAAGSYGRSGSPSHASGGRGRRGRTFRQWLARFSVARLNQAALFGAVALAILLGLIFTRSRALASCMAMLGILLCTLTFSYRLGGRNVYGLIGTFTATVLVWRKPDRAGADIEPVHPAESTGRRALEDFRRDGAGDWRILSAGQRRGDV